MMIAYIEQIRQRLLPSKIISKRVGLKQKSPFEFVGLCPFHNEKTPSFTVSDDKKFYHCFGCGENGDVISFISKIDGISYKDAALKLADEAGVVIPKITPKINAEYDSYKKYYEIYEFVTNYYQQMLFEPIGQKALRYLRSRDLNDEIIKKFRLGYAPLNSIDLIEKLSNKFNADILKNSKVLLKSESDGHFYSLFRDRVMFPIMNIKKQVIAFGGRALSDSGPKYLNSTDNPLFKKGNELYNLCNVLDNLKNYNSIIVVEGYMDVIALHKSGFLNVVAPLGTAFKHTQLELIWNYCRQPTLLFDSDNAGLNATKKTVYEAIEHLRHNKTLKIAEYETYKDPDEIIKNLGSNALRLILDKAMAVSEYIFINEYSAKSIVTPEDKSDLLKRLSAVVDKIADYDLKNQYRNFFKSRFNEIFFKNHKFNKKPNLDRSAIIGTMEGLQSLYYQLICVLIHNPILLDDNLIIEKFNDLNLENPDLEKVRTELLNNYDIIASMNVLGDEKQKLFISLQSAICERFPQFNGFIIKESSIKNIEHISVYAIRLLKLINLDMLHSEILLLSDQIAINANEADFTRLSNLKSVHENLKLELGIV